MFKQEKRHTEWLAYRFTEEEKAEVASSLAQANQSRAELEEKKAQVMAEFKSQITATEAIIAKESRRYNNGYEYRDIECSIALDSPKAGLKTIVRLDTGEFVRQVEMSAEDRQKTLEFEQQ